MNGENKKCRCISIMGDSSSVVCPIHGTGTPRAVKPAVNAPETTMTHEETMRELASGLRDVIQGASEDYIKEDPENAFIDLACTLVLRLRGKMTVVPTNHVRVAQANAAERILDILTRWLRTNPGCSYGTKISSSGTFQLVITTSSGPKLFFGENMQDAYAQAAQTINLSDGEL